MKIKVDKILGRERELDRSLIYSAGKNNNATNSYLISDQVFTNVSPLVITEDCKILSISASTEGNETWTAEIHTNGVLIVGAALTIAASDNGIINDLNIAVTAGDKLSLYCNGTLVKKPRIIVELIK